MIFMKNSVQYSLVLIESNACKIVVQLIWAGDSKDCVKHSTDIYQCSSTMHKFPLQNVTTIHAYGIFRAIPLQQIICPYMCVEGYMQYIVVRFYVISISVCHNLLQQICNTWQAIFVVLL